MRRVLGSLFFSLFFNLLFNLLSGRNDAEVVVPGLFARRRQHQWETASWLGVTSWGAFQPARRLRKPAG